MFLVILNTFLHEVHNSAKSTSVDHRYAQPLRQVSQDTFSFTTQLILSILWRKRLPASWSPAMIRISLPDDEVARLEQVLRTNDGKLRHRAQAVLMASRGRPHPQIAQDVAINQRTVQRWLNAYNRGGLDALVPRKAKGAAPKLTAELAPVLRQWVIDGPAEQGLDRANWTHE